MENMVDFARENNFNILALSRLSGLENSDEIISYEKGTQTGDYIRYASEIISVSAKKNNLKFTNLLFNDNLNNNKIDIKSPPFKCAMPWKSLVIDFNGIRPECICPKGDKISTGSALEEIWNGELMQAYRNNVLMNNKNNLCNNNCWMI